MFHVLQPRHGYAVRKTAALQGRTEPAADTFPDAGPEYSQTISMRMSSNLFRPVVDLPWTCLPIMDISNGADVCPGGWPRLGQSGLAACWQPSATARTSSSSTAMCCRGTIRPTLFNQRRVHGQLTMGQKTWPMPVQRCLQFPCWQSGKHGGAQTVAFQSANQYFWAPIKASSRLSPLPARSHPYLEADNVTGLSDSD